MTKRKDDYPKACEELNEKLRKLLEEDENELDLSDFMDDEIWREINETMGRDDGGRKDKPTKDQRQVGDGQHP